MTDFRSKTERVRAERERRKRKGQSDRSAQLDTVIPRIEALEENLKHLAAENASLKETLRLQMTGFEDLKRMLSERLNQISEDISIVHRRVQATADHDMALVKQLNENQQIRLAQISRSIGDQ